MKKRKTKIELILLVVLALLLSTAVVSIVPKEARAVEPEEDSDENGQTNETIIQNGGNESPVMEESNVVNLECNVWASNSIGVVRLDKNTATCVVPVILEVVIKNRGNAPVSWELVSKSQDGWIITSAQGADYDNVKPYKSYLAMEVYDVEPRKEKQCELQVEILDLDVETIRMSFRASTINEDETTTTQWTEIKDFQVDIRESTENDFDGDGYNDEDDAFPKDPSQWKDTDGDGYGDNSDAYPIDPQRWDASHDNYVPVDERELDNEKEMDGSSGNKDVDGTNIWTYLAFGLILVVCVLFAGLIGGLIAKRGT